MKTNVAIAHAILKTSQEPLIHWKQFLEYVIENSVRFIGELKDVHDLVQKIMDKLFQYLTILYIEYFVCTNVGLKNNFDSWVSIHLTTFHSHMPSDPVFKCQVI